MSARPVVAKIFIMRRVLLAEFIMGTLLRAEAEFIMGTLWKAEAEFIVGTEFASHFLILAVESIEGPVRRTQIRFLSETPSETF